MSKALLRKSLYLPKLEFNQSSWEALSDFERRFLLSRAVDNQEKKFIEGFFAYDKSRPAADIDRQTFLDVLARATQENRLMLVDIIFSANPEEFHIALANHLWHTVFNEESRKMIWLYLSAEKKGMKKAANILDILYAGEAINRDHPLTWPNKDNYVLQNTDRQKYPQILDYALYSKDAALLNNILSLYEVGLDREYAQSESRPNPNGVMFEGSDHPNAILAFTILADAKAQQLQGIAQIKRLWRQIDPGSQKILWFQSLKRVGDVPEDEDACNARVNRMHNILIACQNDTVDENHPLTWIEDGDKALPHFAIMQNLLRDKLPNHDVIQKSWKKLGADVQKMIWFKVVTRGGVGVVGNIINLYRDQPIDENHPLEWRDEKDRNALYAILFSKNINNQVVKKLLETGSFPSQFVRDENAIIYDGIDDESRRGIRHALNIIKQHAKKCDILKQIQHHQEYVPFVDIADKINQGFEGAVDVFLKSSSKSRDDLSKACAERLETSYAEVCKYSIDKHSKKINPEKLSEVLTGFAVDLEGNIRVIDILSEKERQVLVVVMTRTDTTNPSYFKREEDSVVNIVASLISVENRAKAGGAIAKLNQMALEKLSLHVASISAAPSSQGVSAAQESLPSSAVAASQKGASAMQVHVTENAA